MKSRRKNIVTHVYRGFANKNRVYLHGRVLKDKKIDYGVTSGWFQKVKNTYNRFESDEIPYAKVHVQWDELSWALVCDDEGYFTLDEFYQLNTPVSKGGWISLTVSLPDYPESGVFTGEVVIPDERTDLGVITDIDDTILSTGTLDAGWWEVMKNTFFRTHFQRTQVEGASDLLSALAGEGQSKVKRPVFYLSNSPWNLYNYLVAFLDQMNMPRGPVLLRDYGIHLLRRKPRALRHKAKSLSRIFSMYPQMKFILIGDAASGDVDYYLDMVRSQRNQVAGIYIRIRENGRKARRILAISDSEHETKVKAVNRLEEIIQDSREMGWIY